MSSTDTVNATEILKEAMNVRNNIKLEKLRLPQNHPELFEDFHTRTSKDMQAVLSNLFKGRSNFMRFALVVVLDDDSEEDLVSWEVGARSGKFTGLEDKTTDYIAKVLADEILTRASRKKIKKTDRIELEMVFR